MPQIFVISGPNGAGKTTCAMHLLPDLLECEEYVNADAIAAGLSPFRPEETAFQAGRLMLDRIHHLASVKKDFAFETTLASKSFAPFLKQCQKEGYTITIVFLWLESVNLALKRVADRVNAGGHSIPIEVVKRRYNRGVKNFFNIYQPMADTWMVYDNSGNNPILLAEKFVNKVLMVYNKPAWNELLKVST